MPSPPADDAIQENSTPRISVVVAYEDFDAGKRAQRTCQQILQLAHLEKTLSTDLWKFDMFKLRGMWAAAAEEAAGADLLVVAPQDGADLTDNVREWILASLLDLLRPKALLVLAGPVSTNCARTPCHFAGENPPLICGSKSPTPRWVQFIALGSESSSGLLAS